MPVTPCEPLWFAKQNVRVERVLTDNGPRIEAVPRTHRRLALRQKRTRPLHTADQRQVRMGRPLRLPELSRAKAMVDAVRALLQLPPTHSALGYTPPISRLDRNNVLTDNSWTKPPGGGALRVVRVLGIVARW